MDKKRWMLIFLLLVVGLLVLCPLLRKAHSLGFMARSVGMRPAPKTFADRLAYAAEDIIDPSIVYDPAYRQVPYPNGDVPPKTGVCADVVIRAYRRLGIDLQVLVHEDMTRNFTAYPKRWGLRRPDPNIDHRRVYNLMAYFKRHGKALPCSKNGNDYLPGDIVSWLVANQSHIGIVSSRRNWNNTRYMIVHNIGAGQVLQDMLFDFPIIGHFRYAPRG